MPRPSLFLLPLLLDCAASVVASTILYDLSKVSWTLENVERKISVPAKIPSVAHLDLYKAGVIGEPTYGSNDTTDLWVSKSPWTYQTSDLKLPVTQPSQQTFLVFKGLDTFAHISLCNQTVGETNNQFRQWIFDVTSIISVHREDCQLSVTFTDVVAAAAKLAKAYNNTEYSSPISLLPNRSLMRKEQSDFGWDWSPALAPSGIWQPAYLVQLDPQDTGAIYVSNSAVDIFKEGQLNNLPPDQGRPWVLNISLDYVGPAPKILSLDFELNLEGQRFTGGKIGNISVTDKVIQGSAIISGKPQPWWPVGYGNQTLYKLDIKVVTTNNHVIATISKRVGFRTIVLNQGPITKEQEALGIAPGSNWHFEINGRELFVKGSNLVPLDVFWPNVTEESARTLLEAAVAGNQNMLRVWSSGAYLPDFIYDVADELGLLLWSEFQFSDASYPIDTAFLENVREEAYYQVRRVNHHPSLALWCGNNELVLFLVWYAQHQPEMFREQNPRFQKLFLDVLLRHVFDNSRSISYSFSSTTSGYISLNHTAEKPMVPRINETADGKIYADSDYYNYDASQAFNLSAYPVSRLAVEFGFMSHSNFETYHRYMPATSLMVNSSMIYHRNRHYVQLQNATANYSIQSINGMGHIEKAIRLYHPSPSQGGELEHFKREIYASQLFQAEFYRSQIEYYRYGSGRPQRTLGSLYWQLNDVWAAPTWASINVDGRWKVLHYVSRAVYENVIVAPYVFDHNPDVVSIYVTSDLWTPVNATVGIEWFNWAGKRVHTTAPFNAFIGPVNSTFVTNITMSSLPFNRAEAVAFLTLNASTAGGKIFTSTRVFNPTRFTDPITVSRIASSSTTPPVTVTYDANSKQFVVESTALAGWIWLDQPEGIKGHFNDNAFWMLPGRKAVGFTLARGQSPVSDEEFAAWAAKVTIRSLWDSV